MSRRLARLFPRFHAAAPSIRATPRWTTGTGTDDDTPELHLRRALYDGLRKPVTVRWLNGQRLRIFPDNEVSRVVYLTGLYEPNEFLWLDGFLKPGMAAIDVGANQGLYTLFIAHRIGPAGRVLALEPSRRELTRLAGHVRLNRLRNVTCLPVAAGAAPGEGTLRVAAEYNAGHNTLGAFAYPTTEALRTETVAVETIDSVCARQQVDRVDFMKLDIEGAEFAALQGARKIIDDHRPAMLVELTDDALAHQGATRHDVVSFLVERGYAILAFDDGTLTWRPAAESVRHAAPHTSENVIALPPR